MTRKDENLDKKIEAFKEKTGLKDSDLEKIYNAHNYKEFSGEEGKLKYEQEKNLFGLTWREEYELSVEDYLETAKNKVLSLIIDEDTEKTYLEVKNITGFTNDNMISLLQGAGVWVKNSLDIMQEYEPAVILLLEEGKMSSKELFEAIYPIADPDNFGDEFMDKIGDVFYDAFPNADMDIVLSKRESKTLSREENVKKINTAKILSFRDRFSQNKDDDIKR